MREQIKGCGGLERRVVAAGVISGTVRSVLECPFEYAKVKQQTGQQWNPLKVYKGFTTLYPRSTIIMTTYFVQIDCWRRHTNMMDTKTG